LGWGAKTAPGLAHDPAHHGPAPISSLAFSACLTLQHQDFVSGIFGFGYSGQMRRLLTNGNGAVK
jgi:hypothetical protein